MDFIKSKKGMGLILLIIGAVLVWYFWGAKIKAFLGITPKAGASKGATATKRGTTPSDPVLKMGSKGQYVKTLQERLNKANASLTALAVDGDFGPKTEARLKALTGKTSIKLSALDAAIKGHKNA